MVIRLFAGLALIATEGDGVAHGVIRVGDSVYARRWVQHDGKLLLLFSDNTFQGFFTVLRLKRAREQNSCAECSGQMESI